jgi:transposase-like protein
MGKKLSLKSFIPTSKDHEHCVFCWKKIMADHSKDIHREAYTTQDEQHWVCKNCYNDFNDMFNWK